MIQYIVDAFTKEIFAGNPAAACVLDQWLPEKTMMQIAKENNLSETAFIVKEEKGYHLRWFTPTTEINLCGHATLASAFVLFTQYDIKEQKITFDTMSGALTVERKDDGLLRMSFPSIDVKEIPVTDEMEKAFGARPTKAFIGMDLMCLYDDSKTIVEMRPDTSMIQRLPGRLQHVTSIGQNSDCTSRSFAPKSGIAEDPVCGSAHCQIAPFWSKRLNKKEIVAYQASERGGYLYCNYEGGDTVSISGHAILFSKAELYV